MFESLFIEDCYSCIKGRGTSYGIKRLQHHIRACSNNYKEKCYVLKIDITAYFMSINRQLLLNIVYEYLDKLEPKYSGVVDFCFIRHLTYTIIMVDPIQHCNDLPIEEYDGLPLHKTLLGAKPGCGLPIGNLTSQLFSNIFMNAFDHYMKRRLKCKHYGRYVDDAYVVSCDLVFLQYVAAAATVFLKNNRLLIVNEKKTRIFYVNYGVEFLGAYLKPYRCYVSNKTIQSIKNNMSTNKTSYEKYLATQSYQGLLQNYNSYMHIFSFL